MLMPADQRPCSTHSLPIMTYPSDFTGASKTTPAQRSPACFLGTEWPKVLSQDSAETEAGSLTNTHNVFLGVSVD